LDVDIFKRYWYLIIVIALGASIFFYQSTKDDYVAPYLDAQSRLLIPQKNTIIIVLPFISPSNPFNISNLSLLKQISTRIEDLPGVKKIKSLLNAQVVRAKEDDILVTGFLPRNFWQLDSGRQLNLLSGLSAEAENFKELELYIGNDSDYYSIYVELGRQVSGHSLLKKLKTIQKEVDFFYTGKILLQAQTEEYLTKDLGKFIPLLMLGISLIFLILKDFRVMVIAWLVISSSLAAALALVRILQIEITPLLIAIPVFGIGLLSDYLIHFFYHFLRRSAHENGKTVRRRLLLPLVITATSSIIGFLSLCYLGGGGHLFLGVTMSMAILLALGFVFFWCPWFRFRGRNEEYTRVLIIFRRLQLSIFGIINRYQYILLSALVLLFIWGFMQINKTCLNTYPLQQLPSESAVRKAEQILTGDFSGTIPFFLEIDTGEAGGILNRKAITLLEKLQGSLESSPETGFSYSLLTIIKTMNYFFNGADPESFRVPDTADEETFQAMIEQFLLYYSGTVDPVEYESLVDSSYRYFSIKGILKHHNSKSLDEFTIIINTMNEYLPAHWDLQVHGTVRLLLDEAEKLRDNWLFSYLIGTILIFAVILMVYKDLILAFLSIAPGIFSMVLAVGLINTLGIPIDVYSIIFVAIITGLVVDYSIHTLVGLSFFKMKNLEPAGKAVFSFVTDYSGIPIFLSFLTSIAAFSVLLVSTFHGAVILGFLLITSLFTSFVLSVYFLPLLVLSFDKKFITRRSTH
jgi:predicted RND superfamily exporter protein